MLRTPDNLLVSIPNDVLMNEIMVNYNLANSLTGCEVTIGVSDESDLKIVTNLRLEIVRNLDVVADEKCPEINILILERSAGDLKFLI